MSLTQFLVDLGTNAEIKRRYDEDPEGTMTAAGLSVEERAAVHSGNSASVRLALGKPENDCNTQTGQPVPKGSNVKRPKMTPISVTKDSVLMTEKQRDNLVKKKAGTKRARKMSGGTKARKKR